MTEDKELERIKSEKMKEFIGGRTTGASSSASGKPIDLTQETFKNAVERNSLVVVDFWAAWCGPCRIVAPIIESMAKDYSGRILFGKVNVDENPEIARQYGIMSIPTLLVFKNGNVVDQIIGAMPRERLEPKIKKHI
jgi:thioredoxin 1